jgi:hypothetical protein
LHDFCRFWGRLWPFGLAAFLCIALHITLALLSFLGRGSALLLAFCPSLIRPSSLPCSFGFGGRACRGCGLLLRCSRLLFLGLLILVLLLVKVIVIVLRQCLL